MIKIIEDSTANDIDVVMKSGPLDLTDLTGLGDEKCILEVMMN